MEFTCGERDSTVTYITGSLKNYEQLSKNRHEGIKTRSLGRDTQCYLRASRFGQGETTLYFDNAESASRNIASKGPSLLCLTTAANAFSAAVR
jgi:hypothetical protein